MTSHRNQKAAVRAFAAERDISYTEARRLLGLSTLTWEATDCETGVRLQATMRGNRLELAWWQPDGTESVRGISTHVLLELGIWPSSHVHPFTEAGELRPSWDEDPVLPATLTERLRAWVRQSVQAPSVLSQYEEEFLWHSRQPADYAITVVDKHALTATTHVYRNPNPEVASAASPTEIVETHGRRLRAQADAAAAHLAVQHGKDELADAARFYTYDSFPAAAQELASIFQVHRFVLSKELLMAQAGRIDPEQLAWDAVEHTEF